MDDWEGAVLIATNVTFLFTVLQPCVDSKIVAQSIIVHWYAVGWARGGAGSRNRSRLLSFMIRDLRTGFCGMH